MPTMLTVNCAQCKNPFEAREADVKRGWGKFCSKSCKAKKQEQKTGQYRAYLAGEVKPSKSKKYPRHDGRSPMTHRFCEKCGKNAVNGIHSITGRIEWYCEEHMAENSDHPFSSDSLGQW